MGSYVPNSKREQLEMLESIGCSGFEELFRNVPEQVLIRGGLTLPEGCSEMEVKQKMMGIGDKNRVFRHIFRGAGAYRHYIPAIVSSVVNKEEFLTAYTPYQAEISQGILQLIFEYQTMICELTGMDASNASVYDGASAAAEAVAMCKDRKRTVAYVSQTVQPEVLSVIKTYCYGSDTEVRVIPEKDGCTDLEALEREMGADSACFYMQQPNFYGNLEDGDAIAGIVHGKGAKLIMGCNPISLAILKSPAEYGADIAVGEGQPLGMPLAFGGPYLGFMAAGKDMMRKLPGRIVGQTLDVDGKTGYVLTLQAREQHIRREKASSNICSNQALCAMTAAVYMAAMGFAGMERAAQSCMAKAHYLQERLEEAGFRRKHGGEFFHEFVTVCPVPAGEVLMALEERGYLGGLPLSEREILWCATEMNSREEMDELISIVKEVCAG